MVAAAQLVMAGAMLVVEVRTVVARELAVQVSVVLAVEMLKRME